MKSLGFLEVQSVTAAINAIDIMCKTADVELLTWERKLGGRLVTVIVQGSVSSVTQAIDSAVQGSLKPCVHAVIANPHQEILNMILESAQKFK